VHTDIKPENVLSRILPVERTSVVLEYLRENPERGQYTGGSGLWPTQPLTRDLPPGFSPTMRYVLTKHLLGANEESDAGSEVDAARVAPSASTSPSSSRSTDSYYTSVVDVATSPSMTDACDATSPSAGLLVVVGEKASADDAELPAPESPSPAELRDLLQRVFKVKQATLDAGWPGVVLADFGNAQEDIPRKAHCASTRVRI
jgi:hypothetical protein